MAATYSSVDLHDYHHLDFDSDSRRHSISHDPRRALKLLSPESDSLYYQPSCSASIDFFPDRPHLPLPDWESVPISRSAMFHDFRRASPQCQSFPPYAHYGYDNKPLDSHPAWSTEYLSSVDSPLLSTSDSMSTKSYSPLLPSLSTPMSEFFSSPTHTDDFQNVFDLNFAETLHSPQFVGGALPPLSSRHSSTSSVSSSCSSSPSPQTFDISPLPSTSSLIPASSSREPSPTTSDTSHHNSRRRFPCLLPGCSRRFTSQYTLKVHMEAHKPKPKVSFPCTLGCSERFSRQHDRLRHEVAKHGKICEFLCDECGRFFSTRKTLGNHKCPMAQGGTRWVHN